MKKKRDLPIVERSVGTMGKPWEHGENHRKIEKNMSKFCISWFIITPISSFHYGLW